MIFNRNAVSVLYAYRIFIMRFLYFTNVSTWCIIIIESKSVITKEKQNENKKR